MNPAKAIVKVIGKYSLEIAKSLLLPLIQAATPYLIDEVREALLTFYRKAKETANPYDDILAEFLLDIFGIKNPDNK